MVTRLFQRDAVASRKQIIIDLSNTYAFDTRFLGLLRHQAAVKNQPNGTRFRFTHCCAMTPSLNPG
jgi:hypothetical protein